MKKQYTKIEHHAQIVKATESSKRNKLCYSIKLRPDKEINQAIAEPSKSQGIAFSCGIYPAAKRAPKENIQCGE